MRNVLPSVGRFLDGRLSWLSRLLLLVGVACLVGAVFLPLWNVRLVAPQYQEGLNLTIYAYKIEGGNGGQDLVEINALNHYIGMKAIESADFAEMTWVPFILGAFVLLSLRAIAFGRMGNVVDLFTMFTYFGVFSLGSFYYRMWSYGHHLDPKAAITIEPFTPPIFGQNQIANFTEWSYPQIGSYLMLGYVVCLLTAAWYSRNPAGLQPSGVPATGMLT